MTIGIVHSRPGLLGFMIVVFSLGFTAHRAAGQKNGPLAPKSQKWNYDKIKKAREKAAVGSDPLEKAPDGIRGGEKPFQRNCAKCKGRKPEGEKGAPSLRREEVQQAT